MEEIQHDGKAEAFAWQKVETIVDRTVDALQHVRPHELRNVLHECQGISAAAYDAPIAAEIKARLQQKCNILRKLLTHTESTSSLLHRISASALSQSQQRALFKEGDKPWRH